MGKETYKVALVEGLSSVVTQEFHRVPFGDVARISTHELLDAVPEGGDGVVVLVQTQHEAVHLVVLLHESERVKRNVAQELNARLDAPIVLVVHHERVAEKEARLVTAHVPVALRIPVDDLLLTHILAHLLGLLLVNPLRVGPVLFRNEAVVGGSRDECRGDLLEGLIKRLVVQEYPVVVVVPVEAILHLSDGSGHVPHVVVAGQCHKGRIHAGRNGSADAAAGRMGDRLLGRGVVGVGGCVPGNGTLVGVYFRADILRDRDRISGENEEGAYCLETESVLVL